MTILLTLFIILTIILFVLFLLLKRRLYQSEEAQETARESLENHKEEFVITQEELRHANSELIRFKPIIDIEKEVANKNEELTGILNEVKELREKYAQGNETYKRLLEEINLYEDDLELLEYGVYQPRFEYDTSELYKIELSRIAERQKAMVKEGTAAICHTDWTVGNSRAKGELMTKRAIKLTLRAFNGECDSLIAKVRWNNVEQYKKRIEKAFETINKVNGSNDIYITEVYKRLKLDELVLAYELEQKKKDEKEEQRMIREQIREEEKAQRELEKAKKSAEEKERAYQKELIDKQKVLESAKDAKEIEKLNQEVLALKQQLSAAAEAKERAISRAQITKSGHVYVISNIGSFGEGIYKIGMTRRLEPMDRVKELGDASVPFQFDVHAIIYSENAPELETTLHNKFNNRRVNLINTRKEYFNVTLEEIKSVVNEVHDSHIEFTIAAEAEEYRETLALLRKVNESLTEEKTVEEEKYPEDLFK